MATDDANDVAKALAAFGAPSIRYHSFGQSQVRPPPIVPPHRDTIAAATAPVFATVPIAESRAVPVAAPPVMRPRDQQSELEPAGDLHGAALLPPEEPGAVAGRSPAELRTGDAGPAWASPVTAVDVAGQVGPASAKALAPSRPLAEWAPPLGTVVPPYEIAPVMTPPRATPTIIAPPAVDAAPLPPAPPIGPGLRQGSALPATTAGLALPTVAAPAPPAAIEAGAPPSSAGVMAGTASNRSLTDIFALLASGQSNTAATGRPSAEMFKRG